MKRSYIPNYFIFSLIFVPILVFAQFTTGVIACDPGGGVILGSDFACTIYRIVDIIDSVFPLLFTAAFIFFFWGLSKFILGANSATEVQKGRNYMMWGILALFILITFKSIIGIVSHDVFGVTNSPNQRNLLLPEN